MHIEGHTALVYPGFRRLALVSSKGRLLVIWGATVLMGLGALLISAPAGIVLLAGALVAAPLAFDLSLRRTWRRLAAGGPAVDIAYTMSDEGVRITVGGTSTLHRWEALRSHRVTPDYWFFEWVLARRSVAVPRHAFTPDAGAEVDAAVAALR